MTDRNPHTGEKLQSKANSDSYRENFDKIFSKGLCNPGASPEQVTKFFGNGICSHCRELQQFWQSCDSPNCPNQSRNLGVPDNA